MSTSERILVIYTGGTIGMVPGPNGLRPQIGFLQDYLNHQLPEHYPDMPAYELIELEPLLDSSQMQPGDWNRIAQLIVDHYQDYTGFLVIQGTDTLAFTASALAFQLQNLDKPVVLTGSMYSLADPGSDGPDNLMHALAYLLQPGHHQVCVAFQSDLLAGSHVTKMDSLNRHAFISPIIGPIQGISPIRKHHPELVRMLDIEPQPLSVFSFYPGCNLDDLETMVQGPSKAIILRTYGSGNAPVSESLLDLVQTAIGHNKLVVNISQCLRSEVDMQRYEVANQLHDLGVISAQTLTFEALITKLMLLLTHFPHRDQIAEQLLTQWSMELPA